MPLPRPGSFNRTTMSVLNGRLSADGLTGALLSGRCDDPYDRAQRRDYSAAQSTRTSTR
jgi:hypothetical protein